MATTFTEIAKDIITVAKKNLEVKKQIVVQESVEEARKMFPDAQLKPVMTDEGLVIEVYSADPDFLKKELGSDEYAPGNRAIRLANALIKVIE